MVARRVVVLAQRPCLRGRPARPYLGAATTAVDEVASLEARVLGASSFCCSTHMRVPLHPSFSLQAARNGLQSAH